MLVIVADCFQASVAHSFQFSKKFFKTLQTLRHPESRYWSGLRGR
jgi:hypothetical protein